MKELLKPLLAATFVAAVFGAPVENPPVPAVCGPVNLASTCLFTANGGTPVSARTDFIDDWDTQGYNGLTIATHELFHAIGFTVNYGNFANRIIATPGAGANGIPAGSRSYSTNGAANGILLGLTPAGSGTHADPGATGAAPWPATGYNQSNDIMQPDLPLGTARTLSAVDFNVLNNAFGWGTSGIAITVINVNGTHDDTDMAIIMAAVAAIEGHYNNAGNVVGRPTFTWSVAETVPEPGTWGLMIGALLVIIELRRRRRAAD